MFKRLAILILCFNLAVLPAYAQSPSLVSGDFNIHQLPVPGEMVNLSAAYDPVLIKGLKIHPENPLLFDFIIDAGHTGLEANDPQLRHESEKLIKYFLATVTIPENDLWVNLSPYEKNRIIPDELGQTELGRDMLAEDYILKQLTASLIYPEKELGKDFWDRVYTKARQIYGTTQVPVNTFNKVWILADKAKVYVHDNTAFVIATHLKVMLEEDYLALSKHNASSSAPHHGFHSMEANIVRQIILPEIEKEVNTGKNFANLRQIFYSMILATWYKKNLKQVLLNQVYADKSKINGVDVEDKTIKDKIYQQYLQAYKKGVFNYIKEDVDAGSRQIMPRKYFSGGLTRLDKAQVVQEGDPDLAIFVQEPKVGVLFDIETRMENKKDAAMNSTPANLDISSHVLKQIGSFAGRGIQPLVIGAGRYMDNETATDYAREFIKQILTRSPDSPESNMIKEAIKKFNEKEVRKAFRDYFTKIWWNSLTDRNIPNKQIVENAISWMLTADTKGKNLRPYFNLLNHLPIFVTGSTGSLATPFLHKVLRDNHADYDAPVVSYQRPRNRREKDELKADTRKNLIVFGDLRDKGRIIEGLGHMGDNPSKAVVHLGGLSISSMHNPAEIFGNIVNTKNVLEAMHEKKVTHLFFASSLMVHDIYKSPYAMAKYMEEKMIEKYCRKYDIRFVILRLPNVAGSFNLGKVVVGDRHKRLVPALLEAVRDGQGFTMTTGGKTQIGFIDFEDVAELIKRSLAYLFSGSGNKSFIEDVVPKESHTLEEIVATATGKKSIDHGGDTSYQESPKILEEKLGWRATKTLNDIWEEALKLPASGEADLKMTSQKTDFKSEASYMEEVYQAAMDPKFPLDNEDRLEDLLSDLVFSINSTKDDPDTKELRGLKVEILNLFQERLKGYDPNEKRDFVKQVISSDEKLLKLLSAYGLAIQDQKGELYLEHKKYRRQIVHLWSAIKEADSAMTAVSPSGSPGGIDLNAKNFQMEISQRSTAVETHFDTGMAETLKKSNFSGILPVILRITPISKDYFTKYSST